MPWYIYHALKQLFPSGRFFSFFSLMSIVGVMLGVCVLVIVQSVMNGFGEGIRSRLVETQGDIRIRSNEVVYDWEAVTEDLLAEDTVMGVAPFAEGVIMLQHENRPQFPMIRGIDPVAEEDVIPLQKFLTWGDLEEFDDDGVFLGEGLARTLKARPGSVVEVFTPLMLERLKEDEVLLPREFTVIGLFRTGSPQVDGNTMISTLRVMQELYGLEDGVHGMVLKLRPGVRADEFSEELEERVLRPGLRAVSWIEANGEFLFVIEQEKRVISFIIIFIILVASFSIAIALMMAVLRKTREIGLLVAMGGRPHQVAYSFCFQGFVIGTIGTVVGIGLAILCLHYRTGILAGYATLTNSHVNFLGQYDVYEIPVHYLMSDFVVVTCFAIVISTLAGLLPALRAARLKPADALRSE
ncbi:MULTISPECIES: ABC transporter permease [unclassified Lentimonas]|uniref:ABC transporter permease n=1 Tax=unclassified Lentimonas TaxID=2630993 RepID=UPI001327458D|nr:MULTISPECIES: ABC transporter permease [unclassified Lentimonas]CAA6679565.1 Lipoprotein releasing system transmembrane protein LolC [Lentimonas sp. CC4]CAA6687283.1 Lipoprotein releasing system transmembrane protein LolC [Lentimonas sp. CC6]CAA7077178.1 Lipoprotein releasing system transmembrane protein LolC [Lentimonas sp. CC4]CAA7171803.1 Lipoprotein releasing system transmembrane protein LolC [Lentimonas sp. CC21]CAA7183448.1 Lipoprotein releasing system transmembrane protein LolC [Lent